MTMQGMTNAAVLGEGGSNTIYLKNESGTTISAGDKVLFTLGSVGSSTPVNVSTSFTNGTKYVNPPCFFDNSSLVTSWDTNGRLYTNIGGTWTAESAISLYGGWGLCGTFQFFSDGSVSHYGKGNGVYSGYDTKDSTIGLSSYRYVGSYDGHNYSTKTASLYTWDKNANTHTSTASLGTGTTETGFARIFGSKLIAQGITTCKIFEFTSATTISALSTITISGTILYATGLSTGDYIFTTDNYEFYRLGGSSSTKAAHLVCYQVQSDNSVSQVTVPALSQFEATNCFITFDNRSNILSVGTESGAYFYQFDSTNKTFTQIDVSLSNLPSTESGIPYKVMMSPDKATIAVYGITSTTGSITNIYSLTTTYNRIVPNSAYNYNLLTSYTGIATGETDESGNYEIKTMLPAEE